MIKHLVLPKQIECIMKHLEPDYEAYIVGGCVRDFIMSLEPKDIDITTSALPGVVMELFNEYPVIDTGIEYGTVIVVIDHLPIEITTYRIESKYEDSRHPSLINFTTNIELDLSRRDFTMNAIAYHPLRGFIDPFNGKSDIDAKIIKAVGEPAIRFKEDPLRILRALRFKSRLGFCLEQKTHQAMKENAHDLKIISVERIYHELQGILLGDFVVETLNENPTIIEVILPEIKPMLGFNQHNPNHCDDVWIHTLNVIANTPKNIILRLAALFHDMGKPHTFTMDEKGIGHFYGHQAVSEDLARHVLNRLKVDHQTRDMVLLLVKYHDIQIEPTTKHVKRWLNKLTPVLFKLLIELKKADCLAQHPNVRYRLSTINQLQEIAHSIINQNECFTIKQLAINGKDLLELGFKGKEIGDMLNQVLTLIIDEILDNNQEHIIQWIKESRRADE